LPQILTNLCLLVVGFLLFWLQRLLYGPLRPIETEQLYEKAWFAVTETCLAMTIFRGELGGWFLVMFVCLLVGKVWGWIGEGRVEFLEQQPPANPRLFHTRLAISLILAVLFDSFML
jgi:E3 ubiquitin-protein ligase synoviolin